MLQIERHQRDLSLGRRCSDEGICQPHIVALAVVSAVQTALDRQAQVERDNFKRPQESLKTRSFLAFMHARIQPCTPAYSSATVTTEMRSRSCCAST